MRAVASQNTGVSIVCSTVRSAADHRKHQSSASLVFVRGIHRWITSQRVSNMENVSIWWRHHHGVMLNNSVNLIYHAKCMDMHRTYSWNGCDIFVKHKQDDIKIKINLELCHESPYLEEHTTQSISRIILTPSASASASASSSPSPSTSTSPSPFQWSRLNIHSRWRHGMGTVSKLLPLCEENRSVTDGFPSKRPGNVSFDVYFDVNLNKRLNK